MVSHVDVRREVVRLVLRVASDQGCLVRRRVDVVGNPSPVVEDLGESAEARVGGRVCGSHDELGSYLHGILETQAGTVAGPDGADAFVIRSDAVVRMRSRGKPTLADEAALAQIVLILRESESAPRW